MPEVAEQAGVKSARRTVELLEAFAAQDAWLTLSELHTITGVPRSSLHGLLRTLSEAGWLETDSGAARYRLGVRALLCGTAYLDRDPAMRFAREALEEVRDRTGFTAHYARRDGGQIVYLETRESRNARRTVSRVGRALPAHSTALGKALLAELTHDEIDALYPDAPASLTPRTITEVDTLHTECEAIRQRGFATEVEESTPGLRCVAAVVPYRIPGTDALSCAIPVGDVTDRESLRLGAVLAETAMELGRRLRHAGIR